MGNIWTFISYFRWGLNFWLFGVPYTIFVILCILYNLVLNVWFNKFWAHMNLYLFGSTLFLIAQGLMSIPLALELPIWLKHFKVIRLMSLYSGIVYTFVYLLSFLKFYSMVKWEDKDFETYSDIFIALFLVYNLLVHASIIPINIVIALKESSMEFV